MRIKSVEITNFRSIKHLHLKDLDRSTLIFEGPNDVGKSNIVEAIDLACRAIPNLLRAGAEHNMSSPPLWPYGWHPRQANDCFRRGSQDFQVRLDVSFGKRDFAPGQLAPPVTEASFQVSWKFEDPERLPTTSLSVQWDDPTFSEDEAPKVDLELGALMDEAFRLVPTLRQTEQEQVQFRNHTKWEHTARWDGRNLKTILFYYKNSPQLEIQERFEVLRSALADPRLSVGQLNISVETNGLIFARTRQNSLELDLESRSTGIQQLVVLLALAICHKGRILAIEEPELNLSEPTQRILWHKLLELTQGAVLDQVMVTSHSRIFEEEAIRIIVSRDSQGATVAEWAPSLAQPTRPDEEIAILTRGNGLTLPDAVREKLGVSDGQSVHFVADDTGFRILGPQGYADLLRKETEGDDPPR